jgi:hypothetical protein
MENVGDLEAIALQCALGSDIRREMMTMDNIRDGQNPPQFMFEKLSEKEKVVYPLPDRNYKAGKFIVRIEDFHYDGGTKKTKPVEDINLDVDDAAIDK